MTFTPLPWHSPQGLAWGRNFAVNQLRGKFVSKDTFQAEESFKESVERLLAIIDGDSKFYDRIDDYVAGRHQPPFCPDESYAEYRDRQARAITNYCALVLKIARQELSIDGFGVVGTRADNKDAWERWRASGMTSRQTPLFDGALRYGHSWLEARDGQPKIHSPHTAAGLFDDPLDVVPALFGFIKLPPRMVGRDERLGEFVVYDESMIYVAKYKANLEIESIKPAGSHGASRVPVVRVTPGLDINGKAIGVIQDIIAAQDRVNQTVFNRMSAEVHAAHHNKWITGMEAPVKRTLQADDTTGELEFVDELDENGNTIPVPVKMNPSSIMFVENPDAKLGSFPATELIGYHQALEADISTLAALAQLPPQYLAGKIVNVSAEAWDSAMSTRQQQVIHTQEKIGEALREWQSLAAEQDGQMLDATTLECRWRDTSRRSLAQIGDAVYKLREGAELPGEAFWYMIPGATQERMLEWKELQEEQRSGIAYLDQYRDSVMGSATEAPANETVTEVVDEDDADPT